MSIAINTIGVHPTTTACLEALQWLQARHHFLNVLDMGCGNGILSLTAASLWKARVLAADISEQAVNDTRQQSTAHRLDNYVTVIRSDGFTHPMIRERTPYDLIIFNLLAEPIVRMAPDVRSHLAKGGTCILSGILEWMADTVETVYRQAGLEIVHTLPRSPWQTFIVQSI